MLVHKHWLIGIKFLFWPLVTIAALFVLALYLLSKNSSPLVYYVVSGAEVLSLVWLLRNFFDYYLDAWIITNTGIIDIAWHGWFHRESSRVLYSDIQGVSYEIHGVLNTVMRFGTISVEKISTGNSISIDDVKSPRKIEAAIFKAMEDYLYTKNLKDADAIKDILVNVVARENQKKDLPS